MTNANIVILGNGGAACYAVLAARTGPGFAGEIHMICDVREPSFNPMLAPYYLKGSLPWENCFPFGADFYKRHAVTCHFGSPVRELNVKTNSVTTEDGFQIQWDQMSGGHRRQRVHSAFAGTQSVLLLPASSISILNNTVSNFFWTARWRG